MTEIRAVVIEVLARNLYEAANRAGNWDTQSRAIRRYWLMVARNTLDDPTDGEPGT